MAVKFSTTTFQNYKRSTFGCRPYFKWLLFTNIRLYQTKLQKLNTKKWSIVVFPSACTRVWVPCITRSLHQQRTWCVHAVVDKTYGLTSFKCFFFCFENLHLSVWDVRVGNTESSLHRAPRSWKLTVAMWKRSACAHTYMAKCILVPPFGCKNSNSLPHRERIV